MPHLKHITLHRDLIASWTDARETLRLISQLEALESFTLSYSHIVNSDSVQDHFNLVLPKLKELKVIGPGEEMMHVIEDYPEVLDKLESLKIVIKGDASVLLQVYRYGTWV